MSIRCTIDSKNCQVTVLHGMAQQSRALHFELLELRKHKVPMLRGSGLSRSDQRAKQFSLPNKAIARSCFLAFADPKSITQRFCLAREQHT